MATNLKQKSQDFRRFRRTRLKRAMAPILAMFGCTQMEAEGHIKDCFNQLRQKNEEIQRLSSVVADWEKRFTENESSKILLSDIVEKNAQLVELKDAEIQTLKLENQRLDGEITLLQAESVIDPKDIKP